MVFHQERPFTRAQFRRFMFAQSNPYPEMIDLITRLKRRHGLKIAVVSNEGARTECLSDPQVQAGWVCRFLYFLLLRPSPQARPDIFRLALDVAQVPARQVAYIENTPMFVEIAEGSGDPSILHSDHASTSARLAAFGLQREC